MKIQIKQQAQITCIVEIPDDLVPFMDETMIEDYLIENEPPHEKWEICVDERDWEIING